MSLRKDLNELMRADVISEETADRIRRFYEDNPGSVNRRLIMIFGVLGALVSGMGVVLIMAYNWENLSTDTQSAIAFFPLLTGHLIGLFALWQRSKDQVWREGSSIAILSGTGATLWLVSNIYHYAGSASSLVLIWLLLILPVAYILNSGVASLIFISGVTYYAVYSGYFSLQEAGTWMYWPLLAGILPYYYYLVRYRFEYYFTTLHHWLLPLSLAVVLGSFADRHGVWMYMAYFSLFGIFFILGQLPPFSQHAKFRNGFQLTGRTGTAIMLILLSFRWFWKTLPERIEPMGELIAAPEFWMAVVLTLAAVILLIYRSRRVGFLRNEPYAFIFLLFIPCFIFGIYSVYAVVLINLLLLYVGIWTIRQSNKEGDFAELNFGLLIFAVLIFSRFFDYNISFLIRGLLFILVGAGFFIVNYRLYRKKLNDEK